MRSLNSTRCPMHYVPAAEHTGQCSTSYASSAQPARPLRARRLIARAVNDHGSSPPNPLARSANAETIAQRKLELIHDVKTKVRARQETLLAAGNDGRGAAVQNAQTSGGLPTSTLAVAALAGVAVLGLVYKKFFFTSAQQAVQSTVAAVTEGVQQKKLQRDAQARLNEMSDQLRNLPAADLSGKNLSDEGTAYVVEGLAFSNTCRAIDLRSNGIGKVGIGALCQVLPTCAVATLVLDMNSIGDEGCELLAKALSGNSTLSSLDLSRNGIGTAGARALAEALKLNTTLTRLDLSGNAIDKDGAAALAEALSVNTSLEVLVLSDNYLGEAGAISLAESLVSNKSLKELCLKGNELADAGVKALCDALHAREAPIRVLDLGNNSLSGSQQGVNALCRLLEDRKCLIELDLYMNDIGNDGIERLSKPVAANKGLKVLNLGGNDIGPQGAKALATALKGHASLRTLELGYNPLGPEGVQTIINVTKFDLKLDALKLGWCKIASGEGARAVSELLLFNSTLTSLDLRGNSLGNDGAILIGRGLRAAENQKLNDLDLGYNEIKDDGACALAQALKANAEAAPVHLRLNSNYITRFGQVALGEAVDMVHEMAKGKSTTVHF